MNNVSSIEIRAIENRDNPALASIIRTVMPEFGADGPGFAIHDAEVNDMFAAYTRPRSAYFVVVADGVVSGGGGIAPLAGGDANVCELKKMYFLPGLRGRGVGHKIITFCLQSAMAFGYKQCYLETLTGMDAAQHLYKQHGFRSIPQAMGQTGHYSCDRFYIKDI
ncbi:MAG TPA: GNAT family N-acetyltransferase [bacterium]|nr:GNAT family N-acetyltransferase [bacterium]HNB56366.1 GNAT family N-acetyltransferase [bacterium]HNH32929.1 GNAT family N-acetyltransferase [bacterium]HNM14846.1 GNAT family N-acetyltransferase [bacterium]HNO11955.1 GNAT family N-acetyltransferase [bacterium]